MSEVEINEIYGKLLEINDYINEYLKEPDFNETTLKEIRDRNIETILYIEERKLKNLIW